MGLFSSKPKRNFFVILGLTVNQETESKLNERSNNGDYIDYELPSTFAIRTSQNATKNCKRACLSATAFWPTLKTNFFGNSSASIGQILDCSKLIIN